VSEFEPATRAATGLLNPLSESVKSYAIFPGWENTIEKRDSDYQFNPALLSRGNTILIVRGENKKSITGGRGGSLHFRKTGLPATHAKKMQIKIIPSRMSFTCTRILKTGDFR
jgi:hypothetical protein